MMPIGYIEVFSVLEAVEEESCYSSSSSESYISDSTDYESDTPTYSLYSSDYSSDESEKTTAVSIPKLRINTI